MPHFFVDDSFSDSKEVMAIPPRHRLAAVGLWTLCGSWSSNKLTDGWIPNEVLKRLGATRAVVDALANNAGLFEVGTNGVQMTNWSRWQRTRASVKAYRANQADKKRRQRANIKPAATSGYPEMSPRDKPGDTDSCPPGTPQTPVPVPVPKETTTTDVVVAKKTGTRLPDEWMPASSVVAQMRSEHPHVDLKAEHAKFVDYWQAKPGKDARKTDWNATWRNWIRRAAENQPRNGSAVNGIGKPTQKAMGYQAAAERLIAEMEHHD